MNILSGTAEVKAGEAQMVSASALVRNFGVWQDRAVVAPVYIVKRGRPRLVMLATELIEQLAAMPATDAGGGWPAERQPLLDAVREAVILLDGEGRIRFANTAAHSCFGLGRDVAGAPIERALSPILAGFLGDVITRVSRSGLREHLELAADRAGERHLSLVVMPLPDGVGLVAQDVTVLAELANAGGALSAVDSALAALEQVAKVRINLRGYLVRPTQSFARLTRLPLETLASVRFVSMIEIGTRAAVADAIERTIRERQATRIEARLLVNGLSPQPVAIGLAPLERGPAIDGVQAILLSGDAVAS